MSNQAQALICPQCRIPMNLHAEKPADPRSPEEARAAEVGAGVVEQVHTCPQCGGIGTRRIVG